MTEKMNALSNKKGFTLIEMLVVIAIIAVLVAIVIPVVGNSTDKAAAATNAANLRSIKAEITTAMLTDDNTKYDIDKIESATAATKLSGLLSKDTYTIPTAKACGGKDGVADKADMYVSYNDETHEVTVSYDEAGNFDIDYFVGIADGTATPSESGGQGGGQ